MPKKYFKLIVFIIVILLPLFSCKMNTKGDKLYIFLGHIYKHNAFDKVDKRVERINFKKYDKIFLGGDVCVKTSADRSTLKYVDNLFDLSSPDTYWAIGNHDILDGNPEMIKEFTNRNLFYSEFTDGLTILVLDTYLENSILNEQYNLFSEVCDTISKSSHLLVLMHNVVWDSVSTDFSGDDFANGNYPHWHCRTEPIDYFYHSMYPKLTDVQNRGIQVICISGDLGQREIKHFQYRTDTGIWFLGSGISNNPKYSNGEKCMYLVLHNNIENRDVSWEFKKL